MQVTTVVATVWFHCQPGEAMVLGLFKTHQGDSEEAANVIELHHPLTLRKEDRPR